MTDKPLVSIVIPTHNRKKKLKSLLNSIMKNNYPNIEILIVDDASTDGTYKLIKEKYPTIKVYRNRKEKLLAGSRNIGILKSKGQLIFLIDDDNIISKDTVNELVHLMKKDVTIGVVGPLMYYLRDPSRVWCGRVNRSYISSRTFFPERNKLNVHLDNIVESDDFPNAFMIRRSLIEKVGLFDEINFKIHYDEADFCNRVRQEGYRIVLCPRAKVWHDTILPNEKINRARRYRVHTIKRAFFVARNRIIFFRKYSRSYEFAIFSVFFLPFLSVFYLIIILTDSKLLFTQRIACMKSYIKGILEGFRS